MLLGFKTELKLNNQERTVLRKHAGVARHAWNQALHYTKLVLDVNKLAREVDRPDLKIKFPSAIDLHKWLVANVKTEYPWYYEVSKSAPQNALRNLRIAWERCFNKRTMPPKFKKKKGDQSFTLDGRIKLVGAKKIKLPRIGILRTFEPLADIGKIKSVTISENCGRWFISYRYKPDIRPTEKTNLAVGVDLGVKHYATLSNGEIWDAPREVKAIKEKIRRIQWLNRNKVIGSNSWKRYRQNIRDLYSRQTCLKRDFIHKFTTYLAKNFKCIVVEDLNVKGMMANHKLAGAIGLIGFYETVRQLKYKCELYGSKLIQADRWFPSSKLHHKCGWKNVDLKLSDRTFYCPHCDESIDRDLNAALNLEQLAYSS
ncbi:MAG: RNA-guided endonuclease TnpB family protein [Cyanobacteria bacterium P01_F01_bin.13]